ncbi:arpin-like [Actinia tenebrosa]|uniref:Arpin n=1 Tax=Actinia tenebrosa TaxID=6105 RepID=A0A6P8HN54_ACTTE|nr:arpin-like [Actinia tenebrosa]
MSRAHMLYDNKPLEAIPVTAIQRESAWNPQQVFKFDSSGAKNGGVLVEGDIQGRSRYSVRDKSSGANKWCYVVIHVAVARATRRKFDSTGKEIEPNFGETKKVSTGYLMSSYKTCPVGESDKLSLSDVIKEVTVKELSDLTESKAAGYKNCVSFWWDENELEKMELNVGNHVRLRTRGKGPYIDSLSKLNQQNSTVSNYSGGEKTGTSWTDKVMSHKGQESEPQDQQEGVEDDEWDD